MSETEMTPLPVEDDIYAGVEGFEKESKRPRGKYFSLFKWRLALRVKLTKEEVEKGTGIIPEGWKGPFETTNPNTNETVVSYAEFYDRLVVRIINITRDKKDFSATGGGKVINWNFRVIAGGQKATLQFTQNDSALKRFLKVLPNINLEKPLAISAFEGKKKDGKAAQAISFYQPSDDLVAAATTDAGKKALRNTDNWLKIEEYWKRPIDPATRQPTEGSEATGPDGTILPRGTQDEDTDDWDYREQDKFLIRNFRERIEPVVTAIAERYGVTDEEHEDQTPLFSGGDAPQAVITIAPTNPMATSMADAISGGQRATILSLATQVGIDANTISQKLLAANVDELSRDAASYLQYKMEKRLEKIQGNAAEPPVPALIAAPVVEAPPPPPAPVAVAPVVLPPKADDDDDWGEAPVPAPVKAASAPPPPITDDDDDDDDDGWGVKAANPQ